MDTKTPWLDADNAIPKIGSLPAAANSVYEGGRLAWSNASGLAIPSSATTASSKCWGIYLSHVDNSTATPGPGNSGLDNGVPTGIPYGVGVAFVLGDGTVTETNVGAYVYLYSDTGTGKPTVSLSDAGGTRPLVGFVVPYVRTSSDVDPSAIPVAVGFARPDALDPELAPSQSTAFKARVVANSVQIYTGSGTGTLTITATGALSAIDGVTPAINNVLFYEEGATNLTAAKDAGPWLVSVVGATGVSPVLIRPDWWPHGGAITPGAVIQIGGEGTGTDPQLAGTAWKTFAAAGKIIGTDAPVFWPQSTTCAVTLASGTLASARTTMPVRGHLVTRFLISSDPATAPHANTRVWRVSALTAGVTGTASVQMVAESAPGTTNASDVGQYNLSTINW